MKRCVSCGAELTADDLGDLCGVCMLTGGLATDAMGTATAALVAADDSEDAPDLDSFGPYTILRVLGEGGMGTVYLAEQTQPIQRKVALKVVKPGMETRSILSRFEYERQALASMDHPNIARVYDASASGKGRPYFVMEYIDGDPITTYCDRHRLNTLERLELFVPVCQAVQHAHQKGVIHRDLKPSNILVTEQDGKPVPKVIDFGIAKATDQRSRESTMITQFGQFVGTPEYISPEQADLVTNDIDTSSDVYSLGVVLYELLVGAVPFDGASLRKAGMAELLRIIREVEAPSLPAKLTSMGGTASEVAERRRTDPISLRRQLTGDLNWIVMKAVEKDRRQRYLSALELAADLRRHLEDLPVLASPPSAVYRTRKFVRRHRGAVLAAAGVAAALIAGVVATAWEAREARSQRTEALVQKAAAERHSQEASAERARAEAQAEQALRQKGVADERLADVRTLAHSMLFDLDDQVRDLPGATQARETLARLGMQYLNKVSEAAADDSRMRQELGAAYLKVGDLQGQPGHPNLRDIDNARTSYAQSVAILSEQLKADPGNSELRHLLTVASLRRAQLEPTEEKRKNAVDRVIRTSEEVATGEPLNLQAQRDLAEALIEQPLANRYLECPLCFNSIFDHEVALLADAGNARRAVAIRERILVQGSQTARARWELASAQIELATAMWTEPQKEGREALHRALASLEELSLQYPANIQYKRDRARALSLSARLEQDAAHPKESEELGRQALALMQQVADTDPLNAGFRLDLSNVQFAVGYLLVKNGGMDEGMKYLNQAVTLQEEQAKSQPSNRDFLFQSAAFHAGVGNIAVGYQDYKTGIRHQREAESMYRKLAREHPEETAYVQSLAAQLPLVGDGIAGGGDKSAAIPLYQESVSLWEKLSRESNGDAAIRFGLGKARASLAKGFQAIARPDDAVAQDRAAIAIFDQLLPSTSRPDAVRAAQASANRHLATIYRWSRSDWKSALQAELRAATFLEANYAARPDNFYAYLSLHSAYIAIQQDYAILHDDQLAVSAGLRELDISEKYSARNPEEIRGLVRIAVAYVDLNHTYTLLERRAESLAATRKAAAVLDNISPERAVLAQDKLDVSLNILTVADSLGNREKKTEAAQLVRKAVAMAEALVRSDPRNDRFRGVLRRAYWWSSAIAGDLNDFETYIQMAIRVQKLDLEHPQQTAQFWQDLGTSQFGISSAQDLAGNKEAAAQSRRQAIEYLMKGRTVAEAAISSSQGKNLQAYQNLVRANKFLSFVIEGSGDLKAALEYRQAMLAAAQKLVSTDSRMPLGRAMVSNATGAVARLQSLIDPKPAASPSNLGRGWALYAEECNDISLYSCVDEAAKAVEIARSVVAANPIPEARDALAMSLDQWAIANRGVSARVTGAARKAALEREIAALTECRQILADLNREGARPDTEQVQPSLLGQFIENAKEKLAELQADSASAH